MFRLTIMILVTTGCNDNGLATMADAAGINGWPDIVVNPNDLDFGNLGPNEQRTMSFTVGNTGPDATAGSILHVTRITIDSASAYTLVSVDEDDDNYLLPKGQEREYQVVFAPDAPEVFTGLIKVHSSDDDSPVTPVTLHGAGLMPLLQVTPNPLNFGQTNVDCVREHEVTLTNIGNADLVVSQMEQLSEVFSIPAPLRLPLTLAPSASIDAGLRFAPQDHVDYSETLEITSNEPMGVRLVAELGQGHIPASYSDEFSLDANPQADILFFVDQSGSMSDDRDKLVENFDRFITRLDTVVPDWQLIVVTEDGGCSASGIITPDTPDYLALFTEAALAADEGRFSEAGLSLSWDAVQQSADGFCNQDFLRPNALLHVILVSDEAEQSEQPWNWYVNRLVDEKGGPFLVKMSAVAGDMPLGCESLGNSANAGVGFWEATQETGGEFLSLCTDWADHVDTLASASVIRKDYPLSHTPDENTIVVTVNGDRIEGTWRYDEPTNAVIFDASKLPEEGDDIVITYSEPSSCL